MEPEKQKVVAENTVTKIHGQPMIQDIDCLEDELMAMASSFLSEFGGDAWPHRLVKNAAEYALLCLQLCFSYRQTQVITLQDPSSSATCTMGGGTQGLGHAISNLCWGWKGIERPHLASS